MSNFIININYPPIEYSRKASTDISELCDNQNFVKSNNVQLLNNSVTTYSFLSSYTGEPKSKLVITSISTNSNVLTVEYNSSDITNNDLPLEIDISALNDNDNIPNLTVDINVSNTLIPLNQTFTTTIYFYIEDENGVKGKTLNSTFQYKFSKCTSLSSITSSLPISSNSNGEVNYQIVANNNPENYYIIGLPSGINYNPITGLITGTSNVVAVHPITIDITNSAGTSSTATTLEITNVSALNPPVITSPLTSNYGYSENDITSLYGYRIEATNNPTYYIYNIPHSLRPYAIADNEYLIIENGNAPTGTYNIGIIAGNDAGEDSKTLSLTITYI